MGLIYLNRLIGITKESFRPLDGPWIFVGPGFNALAGI